MSHALQVGEEAPVALDQLVRLDAEHVVPRSRRGPHFVVLQQVRTNEHTQLGCMTKRRHSTDGL